MKPFLITSWLKEFLSAISFKEKSGSKTFLIFSKSLMTFDFCAIVEPLVPKCSAISNDDVFSRELLLNMKLMLQMVYTEAAAQISTFPDWSGHVRLRPSFCTSLVHSSAQSVTHKLSFLTHPTLQGTPSFVQVEKLRPQGEKQLSCTDIGRHIL